MAPKPAPRIHAAKNRVGALGLNAPRACGGRACASRHFAGGAGAIAAGCRMAEKRSERLISLCFLSASQRVDVPKRPQSRRSHQRQPPCLGSSKKNNPDASKAARKAFLFDFSTYRRKRRRRRWLQRLSTLSFAFFFGKRRLKRIIFLTTKRCEKSAQKRATASIVGPNVFFKV